MPGFDKTGPMGEGSMTGGGFGPCGGNGDNFTPRRGFGAGRGGGRGRGRGFNMQRQAVAGAPMASSSQQEKADVTLLNSLLERIEALEKKLAE